MSFWVREHCSVCLIPPPAMCSLDAQLSPTLRPHGLYPTRLLWPWDSPGKNTGMGCHFLLQEIFPIQVPNLCRLHLLHWQADSLLLAPPGQHRSVYHTAYLGQSVSSVAQSCPTLCDPMDCSTPGLPVHHLLPEFTQTESMRPSDHLILRLPLLLLTSIFPSIRVFSNKSVLCIRWPKYWSFSFNNSPSNVHPGLISFRMDWLDLLAVQGTLKSLLQHSS